MNWRSQAALITACLLSGLGNPCLLIAQELGGTQTERTAVLTAAAEWLRADFRDPIPLSQPLVLDPRAAGTRVEFDDPTIAVLSRALGASVARMEDTLKCPDPANLSTCRLENAAVFVAIGEPTIDGDSATLIVGVHYQREISPPPHELAKQVASAVPFLSLILRMVKTKARWQVVQSTIGVVS